MMHPSTLRFATLVSLCVSMLWSCTRTTAEPRRPDAPAMNTAPAAMPSTARAATPEVMATTPPPIGERLTLTEDQWRQRLSG